MVLYAYFLALYSIPLVYMPGFMPVLICFNYYSFVLYFKIRECDASSFNFLKIALVTFVFYDIIKILGLIFLFCKKSHCAIDKNYIGSIDSFGSMNILIISIFSIHEYEKSFHLFVSSFTFFPLTVCSFQCMSLCSFLSLSISILFFLMRW